MKPKKYTPSERLAEAQAALRENGRLITHLHAGLSASGHEVFALRAELAESRRETAVLLRIIKRGT